MPLVSVIIPSYRAEQTIVRAVQSVRDQLLDDWELILASDDGVDYLDCLDKAGIADDRIRQVSTGAVGSGEGVARNKALTNCTAPLVANLDADDMFAPDRLSVLAPLALLNGAATCNTGVCDANGDLLSVPFPDDAPVYTMTADRILSPRVPFFPIFRRDLVGDGWTTVPFAADVLFNLELTCRAERYVGVGRPLYRYIKTAGSITQSDDTATVADRGYAAILGLLHAGKLDLTVPVRTRAIGEFTDNRALNRLFEQLLRDKRVASLDEFLEMTDRGRAPWVKAALVELGVG